MFVLAFGEGPAVLAAVLAVVTAVSLTSAAGTPAACFALQRLIGRRRLTRSAALASVAIGTLAGIGYLALYSNQARRWLAPAVGGGVVGAAATLACIWLVKRDCNWPRIQLRTLLGLILVAAIVLAILAPGFP
jgi:hypothetical protein